MFGSPKNESIFFVVNIGIFVLYFKRNQLSKKKLCTKDYVGDLLPVHALIFRAGISTARQNFDAKGDMSHH